ncbi:MAG: precorrin-8X methylmutase [Oligoflexia bacterium]|nr:precorrin-8X methylmutase [Oligoflexia bacterium]
MEKMAQLQQMTEEGCTIEAKSFAIIDRESGTHDYTREEWEIVRRIVHTTGDLDYKHLVRFSDTAIASGVAAVRRQAKFLCDVNMIVAGINKKRAAIHENVPLSLIDDPEVLALAKEHRSTRARQAFRFASQFETFI